MAKNSKLVLGDISEWSGVLSEFHRQIGDGSKTKEQVVAFLENRNPFEIKDIRQEWSDFYWRYFRLKVDFSDVAIPDNQEDFDRVLFIPKELTLSEIVKVLRRRCDNVYLYFEDQDKDVEDVVERPDTDYVISIRDRVKADEELMNLSANQLKERGTNVITLKERLILELKYFDETGKHLDIDNVTLCAGSRYSDGDVPIVHLHHVNRGVFVHRWGPDSGSAQGRVCSREVVSC